MLGLSPCDLLTSVLVDDNFINCVENTENIGLDWLIAVSLSREHSAVWLIRDCATDATIAEVTACNLRNVEEVVCPNLAAACALSLLRAVVASRADDDLADTESIAKNLTINILAVAVEDSANVVCVDHLVEERKLNDQCEIIEEAVAVEAFRCVLDVLDWLCCCGAAKGCKTE